MIVLFVFLYYLSLSCGQTTVKSFQASASFTKNGRTNQISLYYDYNAQRLSQVFDFSDGTSTTEVHYYDRGIQFSMCSDSPNSCQSVAWNLGQWVWFANSSMTGTPETLNGKSAIRYDIQQPNLWNSSIWFEANQNAQGFNPILRARMSKLGSVQVLDFVRKLTNLRLTISQMFNRL